MTVKEKVLKRVSNGNEIIYLPKAKVKINNLIYHYREDSYKPSGKYPFNINPNTLSSDYEIWICGSENIYYLIPKFEIEKIYFSGATPNQTPGQENIITIDIYPANDIVKVRKGFQLDFSTYRNKTISGFEPEQIDPETEKQISISKYGDGGKGEEHKKIKKWVSNNPNFLGLKNVINIEVDNHTFISGDRPDIIFETATGDYFIVEIEIENCMPGAYQALKYRTLLCAEKGFALNSDKVNTSLVAKNINNTVEIFCKKYKVLTYKVKNI